MSKVKQILKLLLIYFKNTEKTSNVKETILKTVSEIKGYYVFVEKYVDPDHPRNLAKPVTVK